MIKTKRDAENLINEQSKEWDYRRILYELTEVTGSQYSTSRQGVSYFIDNTPTAYETIVNDLYKNRKEFNRMQKENFKEYRRLLKEMARA